MNEAALFTLGYGLYVVGARKGDKLNGQISNSVMQVTGEPPRIAVAINKDELTHELISETGIFTVAVVSEEATLEFIGRFGFNSGRDVDKFDGLNYELAASGCPFPTDYILACLSARVINAVDVGTHTTFIGELDDARILGEGVPMTYSFYQETLKGKTPPTAPTYKGRVAALAAKGDGPGDLESETPVAGEVVGKKYVCDTCGWVYDPVKGDPDGGIAPGTAFEDIPDDWRCPICGAQKDDFYPE